MRYIIILIFPLILFSQNKGEISYKLNIDIENFKKQNPEKKMMYSVLNSIQKELNSTEMVLVFDKQKSYFTSEQMSNEANKSPLSVSSKTIFNLNGKHYSDLINKINYHRIELEVYEEDFVIKEISNLSWSITNKTKKIGDYLCYHATSVYNDKKINAWFSPEINFSVGPINFNGLPGAILELAIKTNKLKYSFISTKISFGNKIKNKIKTIESIKKPVFTSFDNFLKLKKERYEAFKNG